MPTPLLPDMVAVTRDALLAQATLSALVGGRIYDQLPVAPAWPLLVVDTVDENEAEWHTGEARVQVDIWGAGPSSANKQQVRRIAAELLAVSRDLRGAYPSGHISNSAVLTVVPAPDADTGRQRLVVDLLIHTNT